ncbi:MAG: transcriptional regulator [Sphingobacteriales bacterium]|nr:transcriptional regulator [Sphingobacteriales bacterium]
MQTRKLDSDIIVAFIRAKSFPEGIQAAQEELRRRIHLDGKRKFYGISRPNQTGRIEYMAAAEIIPGDASLAELEQFIIKKGNYRVIGIPEFRKDIPAIEKAFQQLLSIPGIDPQGACVEWYPNLTDVHCMVRLADKEH